MCEAAKGSKDKYAETGIAASFSVGTVIQLLGPSRNGWADNGDKFEHPMWGHAFIISPEVGCVVLRQIPEFSRGEHSYRVTILLVDGTHVRYIENLKSAPGAEWKRCF